MINPVASVATESAAGAPILVGTSATLIHTPPTNRPDDVLLSLVNVTGADVVATVTIAGGVGLPVTVPAGDQKWFGPFGCSGAVHVTAASANAIYALVSIRR